MALKCSPSCYLMYGATCWYCHIKFTSHLCWQARQTACCCYTAWNTELSTVMLGAEPCNSCFPRSHKHSAATATKWGGSRVPERTTHHQQTVHQLAVEEMCSQLQACCCSAVSTGVFLWVLCKTWHQPECDVTNCKICIMRLLIYRSVLITDIRPNSDTTQCHIHIVGIAKYEGYEEYL